MSKIISAVIFFILFINSGFSYFSKFLDISTNSLEYQILLHPEKYPLKVSSLLASGVKEENLELYLSQISNFEDGIKTAILSNSKSPAAKEIFDEMHGKILKGYVESATTLDVLLKTGKFNCLSSTVFYSSILEDFGFQYKAVTLPTHIFTMLTFDGKEVDVENTSRYGYDIGTNKEAQENFKKLTGFTYSRDNTISEIIDKKGILAYTYGNIAYFAAKMNQPYSAFQNALKSLAIYQEGKYVYTNALAAYSQYVIYLTDVKRDYIKAMDISEEAILNLPRKEMFITNYLYTLDKYINQLVESSRYSDAFAAYENAKKIAGRDAGIEDNLYTRILYRMLNKDQDFPKALEFGKKALNDQPDSQNIRNLMINGLNLLSKKLTKQWESYPKDEEFFLQWYKIFKDDNLDIILENYYSDLGVKYYEAGNPDRGIEIIKKGLTFLPQSSTLKNNLIFIAGNTANSYFKKDDLEMGIRYSKAALEEDPGNPTILNNIRVSYRTMAGNEIEKENYKKAMSIVEEGLKFLPDDSKLLYYKDYINRKGK